MITSPPTNPIHLPSPADRHNENHLMIWGLIPLSIKVSTADTDGRFFLFQHTNMPKGGPPRHVHHDQDEWFYVVQGTFAMECGDDKFTLRPGDSFFAPRQIPHAWACTTAPGTLLTALSPAGTFETFIRDTCRHPTLPSPEEIAQAFSAHNMTVTGPPLPVA